MIPPKEPNWRRSFRDLADALTDYLIGTICGCKSITTMPQNGHSPFVTHKLVSAQLRCFEWGPNFGV